MISYRDEKAFLSVSRPLVLAHPIEISIHVRVQHANTLTSRYICECDDRESRLLCFYDGKAYLGLNERLEFADLFIELIMGSVPHENIDSHGDKHTSCTMRACFISISFKRLRN